VEVEDVIALRRWRRSGKESTKAGSGTGGFFHFSVLSGGSVSHRSSFTVHLSSSIFLSAVDQAQSRRQSGLLTVAIVRGRGEGDQRGSRGMRRD